MKVSQFLTHLSTNLLDKESIENLVNKQPSDIRSAIQTNDVSQFKSCVADKKFYANEVKVTTY